MPNISRGVIEKYFNIKTGSSWKPSLETNIDIRSEWEEGISQAMRSTKSSLSGGRQSLKKRRNLTYAAAEGRDHTGEAQS